MPQNAFFLRTHDLLVSPKMTQRHFFPTLHPLSTVIFATAAVLAFVLLCDSSFNFHCYTQREATPTQKSSQKFAVTSRDFLRERLQSAFTLANQLCWTRPIYCLSATVIKNACITLLVATPPVFQIHNFLLFLLVSFSLPSNLQVSVSQQTFDRKQNLSI